MDESWRQDSWLEHGVVFFLFFEYGNRFSVEHREISRHLHANALIFFSLLLRGGGGDDIGGADFHVVLGQHGRVVIGWPCEE